MRFIYNTFLILALSSFLFSCAGFKLKKKSESGEEFLIEKKDPLVLPPDFSKLPKPDEQPENTDTDKDINIKSVFDGNQSSTEEDDNQNSSNSNIKKSISEKIQKQ